MTEPETAFPLYQDPKFDKRYILRMHDVYMKVTLRPLSGSMEPQCCRGGPEGSLSLGAAECEPA
jgi:hypothetical protein